MHGDSCGIPLPWELSHKMTPEEKVKMWVQSVSESCDTPVILVGDEVVVIADHHFGEGFLDVSSGSVVEVQHVDSTGDLFGVVLHSSGGNLWNPQGWLHAAHVSPRRSVGDLLVVRKGSTRPFCRCVPGDILEVISTEPPKTTGSSSSSSSSSSRSSRSSNSARKEQLWCQNRRDHSMGWIPLANLSRRMSDSEAKQWKQEHWNPDTELMALRHFRYMKKEADLRPFPNTSPQNEMQTYEVKVLPDELVELLEESDASGPWTKIMLCRPSKIRGWVPSIALGEPAYPEQAISTVSPLAPVLYGRPNNLQAIPEAAEAPDARENDWPNEWPGPSVPPVEDWKEISTESTEHIEPPLQASPSSTVTDRLDRPRKILLSSFGIETLDPELTHRCQLLGGGARCQIPDSEISAALRRQGADANIILDARDFPDPNSWALSQLGHSGRHYQIVANLVCHRNFWYWLREAKTRFHRELGRCEASAGEFSLAIYCRRGKHRSVAALVILRHILEAEGHECSQWHMSYKQWCCYLHCDTCCNPPEELQAHLDQAFEYWRNF